MARHTAAVGLPRSSVTAFAAAVALLASLAGTATANRQLRIGGGAITAVETSFAFFEEGGAAVICVLTLNGTVATSVQKTAAGQLPAGNIGEITSGRTESCRGFMGEAIAVEVLAEPRVNGLRRPWPLRYDAFLGTLPNINGLDITILGMQFRFNRLFGGLVLCLYAASGTGTPALVTIATARMRLIRPNAASIVRELSSVGCPARGEFSALFEITPRAAVALGLA